MSALVDETPAPDDDALTAVEDLMLRLAGGIPETLLRRMAREQHTSGGKRLRARLALDVVEALDAPRDDGVAWAAACEILHGATLVHDDVQDGDRRRRGKPSAWVAHGTGAAITLGDILFMHAFRALEHARGGDALRWRLARVLARGAERCGAGQVAEDRLAERAGFDWVSYDHAALGKTGAPFGLPAEGAALVAGLPPVEARQVREAFEKMGLLFQICDDVLDLGPHKGRAPGGDLRRGRVTAVVLAHLELHPRDEPTLRRVLRTPPERTSPATVERWLARFAEGGATARCLERARELAGEIQREAIVARRPRLASKARDLTDRILRPLET